MLLADLQCKCILTNSGWVGNRKKPCFPIHLFFKWPDTMQTDESIPLFARHIYLSTHPKNP